MKNCMDPKSLLSGCEFGFHKLVCILPLMVLKETFT